MANNQNNSNSNSNSANNNNNNLRSVSDLRNELKSQCANMTTAEAKEHLIKQGYKIELTGEKPAQHYTVFSSNGVRIANIEQVRGIANKRSANSDNSRKQAAKTWLQKFNKVIDNVCSFAEEVEAEAHEAAQFKNDLCSLELFVNLKQAAEAADQKEAEAAEAEAARIAKIAEQKTAIEALKRTSIKLEEVVTAWIAANNFVYDDYFADYMTADQLAQYKPAEAEATSEAADQTSDQPTSEAEAEKIEVVTEAAEANKPATIRRSRQTA